MSKLRTVNIDKEIKEKQISPLAASLFHNLCAVSPSERYSARVALNHPWITRKNDDIPKNLIEEVKY